MLNIGIANLKKRIRKVHSSRLDDFEDQLKKNLLARQQDAEEEVERELEGYEQKHVVEIKNKISTERSQLIVNHRIDMDQKREELVDYVVDGIIADLHDELVTTSDTAQRYYRDLIQYIETQYDEIEVLYVHWNYLDMVDSWIVSTDYTCDIRPMDKIGLKIEYADYTDELNPESMYQTLRQDLRDEIRSILFG